MHDATPDVGNKNDEKKKNYLLLCEKELNENWSDVERYTNEIERILPKKAEDFTDRDLSLLRIAAICFVQHSKVERLQNIDLFGIDLSNQNTSPCGQYPDCKSCKREVCIFDEL